MSGLTTLDAARGMQRRHAKLLRDIDRLRSILPPDFLSRPRLHPGRPSMPPGTGNASSTSPVTPCPSSSWAGQNTKIRWMAETVRRTTQTKPRRNLPPGLLASRLNQPSRKISEPEHLHGVGPPAPHGKEALHAGQ